MPADPSRGVLLASRTSWVGRAARVTFDLVVAPFFTALSLGLAYARASEGTAHPTTAQPDAVLVAVILFLAMVAAYGLDQLLAGVFPSRRRWFTDTETELVQKLHQSRGRGNVTVARVWGAPVRVHWSIVVGLALMAWLQPGAWVGYLGVIVSHELGHAVLVRRFGQRVVALSFHALGGECSWEGRPTVKQRRLIVWGGVGGQAALLVLALCVARLQPAVFSGWFGEPLQRTLVHSNLAMAAFNLLPISPLDGAEAWRLLFPRLRRKDTVPLPSPGRNEIGRDAVNEAVESALRRALRRPQ